ncbi:MAG: hypothetical protein LBR71_06400 [Synergistaceae bacterium]|jgi:hypothetical protein|nr:hypothetical protein [Synergistaceae bacterium]
MTYRTSTARDLPYTSRDFLYGVVQEIQSYADLEKNWDGEGALPVIEEVRNNATSVVRRLYKTWGAPEVTPSSNGTIVFEWSHDNVEFYLEIGKDNYCFLAGDENGYRNDLALAGKLEEASYREILSSGGKLWKGYSQENISVLTPSSQMHLQTGIAHDA